MSPLILSEYRKLATLRSTWVAAAVATVFSAVVAAAGSRLLPAADDIVLPEVARGVAEFLWLVVTVVAILASAGEFQHRTIRTTLLVAPRRSRVLGAKAVVAAGYGAALTAWGMGVAMAGSAAMGWMDGTPVRTGQASDWLGLAGAVVAGGLFAMLAGALGMLTRSTAFALTALLLWRFVGEGILPVVARRPGISDWTPTGAAHALVGPVHDLSHAAGGGLLLAGYVAVVAASATVLFLRRDPS